MLTLTHHVNPLIGAYWYTLEGEVMDSEGNLITVGEGSAKKNTIEKAVKFYSHKNGFMLCNVKHVAKQE